MNKIEQLKSLEDLFLMLERQAEDVRKEILKRTEITDLQYDSISNKLTYVAEGNDDGISCGYAHYESIDELLKYHVIEED